MSTGSEKECRRTFASSSASARKSGAFRPAIPLKLNAGVNRRRSMTPPMSCGSKTFRANRRRDPTPNNNNNVYFSGSAMGCLKKSQGRLFSEMLTGARGNLFRVARAYVEMAAWALVVAAAGPLSCDTAPQRSHLYWLRNASWQRVSSSNWWVQSGFFFISRVPARSGLARCRAP